MQARVNLKSEEMDKQNFKIDLFSDTNSSLRKDMREYMCNALVGNEVAGEDPTVNELLAKTCEITGKEAATFLPSGSMCNILAFRTFLNKPGDGIIFEETSHPILKNNTIFGSTVQAKPMLISGDRGVFSANQLEDILSKSYGYNESEPCLVSIENPTNFGGGKIWKSEELKSVSEVAKKYSIPTYMDAARLFYASAKTNISIKDYAKYVDALYLDFCKPFGAPLGGILAGSKNFIDKVWFHKFQLGGYMHKAGILAAACIYGIENYYSILSDVINNTFNLAKALANLPFIEINLDQIETNIIIVTFSNKNIDSYKFEKALAKKGIRVYSINNRKMRIITHIDIGETEIQMIKNAFEEICTSLKTKYETK